MTDCEHFLDTVCAQIHWRSRSVRVRRELAAHLEDHIAYLVGERGLSYDEAEQEAIVSMGDPVALGQALGQEHCPWRYCLIACITLAVWGAIFWLLYTLLRHTGML